MSISSLLGGTTAASAAASASSLSNNSYNLKPEDFINLMVTQLENQDPTQPTDNTQLLSQMSQIGQLQSADSLQTTLSQITLQNSLGSAGNLIGKSVTGTDSTGAPQSGLVNSVKVESGQVYLQLDSGNELALTNVTAITSSPGTTATGATTTTGLTTGTATGSAATPKS